jgi:hypothetical protein
VLPVSVRPFSPLSTPEPKKSSDCLGIFSDSTCTRCMTTYDTGVFRGATFKVKPLV